jgi:hypothetical protein
VRTALLPAPSSPCPSSGRFSESPAHNSLSCTYALCLTACAPKATSIAKDLPRLPRILNANGACRLLQASGAPRQVRGWTEASCCASQAPAASQVSSHLSCALPCCPEQGSENLFAAQVQVPPLIMMGSLNPSARTSHAHKYACALHERLGSPQGQGCPCYQGA